MKNESATNESFTIQIGKQTNRLALVCSEGCSRKKLAFSSKNYQPQPINEKGMTELNNYEVYEQDSSLVDFLFTITKTTKRIELKSFKRTSWEALTFDLSNNEKQVIDQNGMK